ncbi:MAG: M28 family peptidase [Acidobacteriota bacterium]
MSRYSFVSAVAALALVTSPLLAAPPAGVPEDWEKAAEQINPATLRSSIAFLANDLVEGRGPATRGDSLARLWIATQFESLGLRPGGANGSWEQPVPVVGIKTGAPAIWSFKAKSANGAQTDLKFFDDYIATSGVQSETAGFKNAELVFVGYGIQAPEYGWDDFKGANLEGKILVMLNNDPDWDDHMFAGKTRLFYGRWVYKYESAARQHAAGAIIIHTTPSAGYPFQVVQTSWTGERFGLPAENEPRVQLEGWATEAATRRLLASAGQDLDKLVAAAHRKDFKPVPLGITTSIELHNTIRRVETANVIGVLPGGGLGPNGLAAQAVLVTAHHDHLGIGKPNAKGDTIYNGAEDNASGISQMLSIARAMVALPERPARSLVFIAWAAEEQGLLGSKYYSLHPTVPAGRITAIVNYDGGALWGRTHDIGLIGNGKSNIDDLATEMAAVQGRIVVPDQFPDRGSFYRSDQFNLAKIGVPALYFKRGIEVIGQPAGYGKQMSEAYEANDYHQPSDELTAAWNFDGMVDDARLGFLCTLALANRPVGPTWNPGDEFEAARKKALAEAGN